MSEKVKLKKLYVKLKQTGSEEEASKVLRQIWNFGKELPIKVEEPILIKSPKKRIKKKSKKSHNKFTNISDLSKIKGIGKETLSDISSLYSSIDELIEILKSNKSLPLRNDIEKKLRKELILYG